MTLQNSLVAYYKLDSNSNDSVGSNNGTDTSVSYVAGKLSNAASYSGGTSYTEFGTKLNTVWDNPYTISMWIKPTTLDTTNGDVLLWAGDKNQQHIIASTGYLALTTYDGTVANIQASNNQLSNGNWYHVVFQRTSGTDGKLYVNGSECTYSSTGMRNPASTLTQGYRLASREDATSANFNGVIDEVGVWSRALTADEVSQVFNSGRANAYPLTDTPSLYGGDSYYKLDESSGNASDSIKSNTLTNSSVTYSAQKINNGAVFNGSTGILRLLNTFQYAGNFSISGWVKATTAAGGAVQNIVINELSGTAGGPYQISLQTSGKLRFSVFATGTGTETYVESTGALSDNILTFFTCVRDGTNIIIYLNGSSNNSTAWSTAQIINSATYFQVGATQNSGGTNFRQLTGAVDELGVWNRALSSTEVSALYASGNGKQYPFSLIEFTITEVLALVEGVTALRGLIYSTAETLSLSESWSALKGISFTIAETLGLVEATSWVHNKVFTVADSLGLVELGYVVKKKWNSVAKSVTSWTSQNKSSTSWNSQTKSSTNWNNLNKS